MPPAIAANSKPLPAPAPPAEHVDNNPVKAPEDVGPDGGTAAADAVSIVERGPTDGDASHAADPEKNTPSPISGDRDMDGDGGEVGKEPLSRSESPEQQHSFFGKFGGAMMSFVGRPMHNKEETADGNIGDKDGEERRLYAPGEYPLSAVQSPMEAGHESDPEPKAEEKFPGQDAGNTSGEGDEFDGAPPIDHLDDEENSDTRDGVTSREAGEPGEYASGEEEPDDPEQTPEAALEEDEAGVQQGSPSHEHDEDFDMSGKEAIPGTMTHGMDQPEMLTPLGERHLDESLIEQSDYLNAVDILETVYEEDSAPAESPSWESSAAAHGTDTEPTSALGIGHDKSSERLGHYNSAEALALDATDSPGGGWVGGRTGRSNVEYDIASPASSAFISDPDNHVDTTGLEEDERTPAQEKDPDETLRPETRWGEDDETSGDVDLEHYEVSRDSPDFDEAAEPRTPTEGILPNEVGTTLPFIEYVPEAASGADVPEQSQDPPHARDARAGLDVLVPQIDGGLNPPGLEPGELHDRADAGIDDLDDRLVSDPGLRHEDPGLHDALDDDTEPPYPAEEAGSDYPTPWFSAADSESQAFVTPLQSTGNHSSPPYEEVLDGSREWDQQEAFVPDYNDRDLGAATVQGQDDLFDDSGESAGSENAEGAFTEPGDEEAHPESDRGDGYDHDGTYHESPDLAAAADDVTEDVSDEADDATAEPETTRSIGQGSTTQTIDSGYRSETPANELRDLANQAQQGATEPVHRQATPQPNPQAAQEQATPDASPVSLRPRAPSTPFRGLADSRHAPKPDAPVTPPRQTGPGRDDDAGAFAPRDVTHIPWHSRADSTPLSLRSQTTLSSSPSSPPAHASLAAGAREPAIRDSWPAPVHQNLLARMAAGESPGDRPRSDSLGGHSDFDAYRYEAPGGPKSPLGSGWPAASPRQQQQATPPASPRNSVGGGAASSSPSSLFQKMRSIFEQPGGGGGAEGTPPRPRPVSGVWYPVDGKQDRPRQAGEGEDAGYDSPYDRRGGFLNEAEGDIDERSALLRSADAAEARAH